MELSQKELAEILSLSTRRIRDLEEEGVFLRSESRKYDLKNSIQGYLSFKIESSQGDPGLTEERIRLTKINADRKELLLKRERGDQIRTDVAMRLWGNVCQLIRHRLLGLPSKLAPIVFSLKSIPEVNERIEKSVYEVLNEISNPNLSDVAKYGSQKPAISNKGRIKKKGN
jgi:phage terminase Nu1 subunit (DNA packaging protein)